MTTRSIMRHKNVTKTLNILKKQVGDIFKAVPFNRLTKNQLIKTSSFRSKAEVKERSWGS